MFHLLGWEYPGNIQAFLKPVLTEVNESIFFRAQYFILRQVVNFGTYFLKFKF